MAKNSPQKNVDLHHAFGVSVRVSTMPVDKRLDSHVESALRALPHKAPQASPGSARPIPHGSAPCETALQVQARSEGAGRYIEAVSNAIPPGAQK